MRPTRLATLSVLVGSLAAAQAQPSPPEYRVRHRLDGGEWTHLPEVMNERHQVVGEYRGPTPSVGFRWSAEKDRIDYTPHPADGDGSVLLRAINRAGLAVGDAGVIVDGAMRVRAVMLTPNGQRVQLPHPGSPEQSSRAVSVNDAGVIIGQLSDGLYRRSSRAVRWNPDGSVELLDIPPEVQHINNRGDIAGQVTTPTDRTAFLQQADGTLHHFALRSVKRLLDDGTVAGYTMANRHKEHAAVWTPEGGVQLLPRPLNRPATSCWANGMNSQWQVVGECFSAQDGTHAILWQRVGGEWQLVDLSWHVQGGWLARHQGGTAALHITEAGTILGYSWVAGQGFVTMILEPQRP
ncbi:hypothetical protein [Ideonella sp.]|uniref:hypothetical protein n=1 Tax=Ideonella sp. TaxID=1929293 RepID=UPI0035B2A2A0